VSDLPSSENEEDGEDKDDDEEHTGHGKMSDHDEPGWVMGTICKTVHHRTESFQQMHMRRDFQTLPGWVNGANYIRQRDMKYEMTELKVPAVGKSQTDSTAATPSPTTCGELLQALDIVPGQSQIAQVTTQQGSCQMRLGWDKPQADNHVVPPMPAARPKYSQIEIVKPVQPESF